MGLEKILPRQGGGCKPTLPIVIEDRLLVATAISSFINLACAEMNKTPDRLIIAKILTSCLVPGPTTLKDFESLY